MGDSFKRGLYAVIGFGTLGFLLKVVFDFMANFFRPWVMVLLDREYLVMPITIVGTFVLIVVVGLVITWIPLGWLGRRFMRNKPGVMVVLQDGVYFIAAIIKKVEFKQLDGTTTILYVVYAPSAPFPWSGFPILFAKEERVFPIGISFGRVYGITTSFGRATPDVLEEHEKP